MIISLYTLPIADIIILKIPSTQYMLSSLYPSNNINYRKSKPTVDKINISDLIHHNVSCRVLLPCEFI